MRLYYHKDPAGNFGDDLNPWLWSRLLPGTFSGYCFHEPKIRGYIPKDETLFLGIGTLLNHAVPALMNKVVFGSGAGYGARPVIDKRWDILCVRGPLTARALGLSEDVIASDPAILLRTFSFQSAQKRYRYAYMPHCKSSRLHVWKPICEQLEIRYIDPAAPIDLVLAELLRTNVLITEAMHGAIVADALRVPWIPVSASHEILEFKWVDWCLSLGMTYDPVQLPEIWPYGSGVMNMRPLKQRAKAIIAQEKLRQITRKARPMLSAESKLNDAVDRLRENLDKFKERYPEGSKR